MKVKQKTGGENCTTSTILNRNLTVLYWNGIDSFAHRSAFMPEKQHLKGRFLSMTIYDIAKEANVSIATVSRAMNSPSKVSPKTLARIQAVLARNNYFPNAMARSLANNKSKTVGILVSDIRNSHFSSAAYVLERLFFDWGYTAILCNTGEGIDKKKEYIRILAEKRVDGLIILGSVFNDMEIQVLITSLLPEVPVITSNLSFPMNNCYSVQVNHEVGMGLAIDHLISRGFQNISFVKANNSVNTQRKIDGFLHIMVDRRLPVSESHIFDTEHGPDGGRSFARDYLPYLKERQAFIFMDDFTAVGAVSEFLKHKVQIPEQVGIIGHDNSTFGLCSELLLTTINTHIEKMSTLMATALRDLFLGRTTGNSITVFPDLIVRETT